MDDGTITTLAGDAGADDPTTALRAIHRLRAELDRAEGVAVRRARNASASWQLIALCLGVSRQGGAQEVRQSVSEDPQR